MQVAAGALGDAPASAEQMFNLSVRALGRLSEATEFANIVVRSNPAETQASMALIGRVNFGDTRMGLKYEQWNNTKKYGAIGTDEAERITTFAGRIAMQPFGSTVSVPANAIGATGAWLLCPTLGRSITLVVMSGAVTMKITSSTSITSM